MLGLGHTVDAKLTRPLMRAARLIWRRVLRQAGVQLARQADVSRRRVHRRWTTLNSLRSWRRRQYRVPPAVRVFTYALPIRYRSRRGELELPGETFRAIAHFFGKPPIATADPEEADLFFVPLNLIQFQFRNEDPGDVIGHLSHFSPDRHDHLLVATGDFSQRSKRNHFGWAYAETYTWLEPFILLALESTGDLIPQQDIGVIPVNTLARAPKFNRNHRPFLYSFLGELDHAPLPEEHVRSRLKHLRSHNDVLIARTLEPSLRRRLRRNYSVRNDFELVARNSTFTLAPAGFGRWTYRFFQAISWGSIPVLLSDDYIKPFADSIPYDDFTLTLPEAAIDDIDEILRDIQPDAIKHLQRQLEANQHHFTYDAFFAKLTRTLASHRLP